MNILERLYGGRDERLRERERLDALVDLNTPIMAKLIADVEGAQRKTRAAFVIVLADRAGRIEINAFDRAELRARYAQHLTGRWRGQFLAALDSVPDAPAFHVVALSGLTPRIYTINPEELTS